MLNVTTGARRRCVQRGGAFGSSRNATRTKRATPSVIASTFRNDIVSQNAS
jgi:hypothetical protein